MGNNMNDKTIKQAHTIDNQHIDDISPMPDGVIKTKNQYYPGFPDSGSMRFYNWKQHTRKK
jgi:hypothetical protein